jgi:hypothetical protein
MVRFVRNLPKSAEVGRQLVKWKGAAAKYSHHLQGCSMNEAFTKRRVEEWRAAELRVTAFPANDVDLGENLWEGLKLGPEAAYERKKGTVTIQGPALGYWLVLTTAPGRIDWLCLPEPSEDLSGFVDIGEVTQAVPAFINLVQGWLRDRSPDLFRLAFGATVRLPVHGRNQGYRHLSCYLPFSIDAERSSDFLYQINRPRPSQSLPGVGINRLTRWSVTVTTNVTVELPAPPMFNPGTVSPRSTEHACQIVLDVNSMPGLKEPFTRDRVLPLLDELVAFSVEIVREGDIQ